MHYCSNHPTNHKCRCVKTLFDRAQLYCSDRTILALDRSNLLNMFRKCGYPLSFIRRSMRRKIPRGPRQKENLTHGSIGGPTRAGNHDGQPFLSSAVSPSHLPGTSEATTSQRNTHLRPPVETKVDVNYKFQCKRCNAKDLTETGSSSQVFAIPVRGIRARGISSAILVPRRFTIVSWYDNNLLLLVLIDGMVWFL